SCFERDRKGMHAVVAAHERIVGRKNSLTVAGCEMHRSRVTGDGIVVNILGGHGDSERVADCGRRWRACREVACWTWIDTDRRGSADRALSRVADGDREGPCLG